MTPEEKLIEVLRGNIAPKEMKTANVIQGVAKDVGNSSCSVELTANELIVEDVQYSVTDENELGVIFKPKEGTNVLVGLIGNDENSLYIIRADEVELITVTVGESTIEITEDEIILNDGDNGGLVISENTATALNDIQTSINDLKTIFSSWTPSPQDGGTALKTAVTSWASQTLVDVQAVDLENDKIMH